MKFLFDTNMVKYYMISVLFSDNKHKKMLAKQNRMMYSDYRKHVRCY